MQEINATNARKSIYTLINKVNEDHTPIVIGGKRNKAVLISAEDWEAINETLHLLSIPGMGKSIRDGLQAGLDECSDELPW